MERITEEEEVMSEKETDLESVKIFYEPHPGMLGAVYPIPGPVQKVAHELDGKTLTLREAVEKIKAVTSGEVKVRKDCILLHIGIQGGVENMWRVVRFKDR